MANTKALEALRQQLPALQATHEQFKAAGLALDMTRGKPCKQQLDLSVAMLNNLSTDEYRAADGTDARNYGGIDGLLEAKALLGELLDVPPEAVLVGDNSSLSLMAFTVAQAMSHGVVGSAAPWREQQPKFLCPVPGYDRHFSICQHWGIEMPLVEMREDGPDMDAVEAMVAGDASIKGMWLVPKYSNPTGVTFSERVVERLAKMKTAAPDFRLFWDNAYAVHHLTSSPPKLANILDLCREAGNPDRVFIYGSTSKITFAGAGLAAMAASAANLDWMRKHRSMVTIGPDKINQLRHVKFLKNGAGVAAHMRRHAEIIGPKFTAVQGVLQSELGESDVEAGLASWTKPVGGYFISLDTPDGCAKRVVQLAAEAGVKLTSAGATFPYGKDPRDRNIRIAPTLPSLDEIEKATRVLANCIKLAVLEKSGS